MSDSCNFQGYVPKDSRVQNLDSGQSIRVNRASVCGVLESDTIISNNITTNNLTVNNLTVINEMPVNICLQKSLGLDANGCIGYNISYANTVWVAENGDNATASRERFDCPFATPWDAIDANNTNPLAAQVGDTVIILPGNYTFIGNDNSPNRIRLVKDQVRVFAYPGVNITFATTGASVQPFFDDGLPMVSEFRGFARIVCNYTADRNRVLSNIASRLILEGDEFIHAVRFFNSNGALYHFKARRDEISLNGGFTPHAHVLAHRQGTNSVIDLKYHVDEASVPSVFSWTQYDFRNFDANSKLDVFIGRLFMSDTSRSGVFYLDGMRGKTKLWCDQLQQRGTPVSGFGRSVLFFVNAGGENDIRIRAIDNEDLLGFRGNTIISAGPGTIANGTIELEGRFQFNVSPGTDPTNNLIFFPGSQVVLDLNLNVTNPNVNRALFNVTGVPSTVYITGKVNYIGGAGALNAPFQINTGSASAPTFKDFTLSTTVVPFVQSVAGAASNIRFIDTWCNVQLPLAVVNDLLLGSVTSAGGAATGSWFFNAAVTV